MTLRFLHIFLYLVWFSLCLSLFWQLRDNGVVENLQFLSCYFQKRLEHKENQNEYRKMTSKPRGILEFYYSERGQLVFSTNCILH